MIITDPAKNVAFQSVNYYQNLRLRPFGWADLMLERTVSINSGPSSPFGGLRKKPRNPFRLHGFFFVRLWRVR
ncbi:MAG: hypothetical protein AAGL18_11520, partial [Pseudomonadota bacterium]